VANEVFQPRLIDEDPLASVEHIIEAVVGHVGARQGMTLGRYSGGPSVEQKRACVEAVRLPD